MIAHHANRAYCFSDYYIDGDEPKYIADAVIDEELQAIIVYARGKELTRKQWDARKFSFTKFEPYKEISVDSEWLRLKTNKIKDRMIARINNLSKYIKGKTL
ncbi:hypothetical protein G9A89_023407 [Geosiphon pyriformis]|nr:hypothetical protein G9A89_023407 [Geosiphon pyriformis]